MFVRSRRCQAVALAAVVALSACTASEPDATTGTTLRSGDAVAAAETTTAQPSTTQSSTTQPPTTEPTTTTGPTSTTEPDNTPVVIDGGEWQITEKEIAELHEFVEVTHELEFTSPVEVNTLEDIGREFAIGFEPIEEPEWVLMRAFRLVPDDLNRSDANQIRLDRIRGVCCDRGEDRTLSVSVEIQSTEAETETIIVHELVHALHRQNVREFGGEPTSERPYPWAAALEGVPQYVAFAYVQSLPEAERQAVEPELPIITDSLAAQTGAGPTDFLNFVYGTGPTFTESVVDELGVDGLIELIRNPPATNEQVLFPDSYLDGETAVAVERPIVTEGLVLHEGTLGVAMLSFALDLDQAAELAALQGWAGDSYVSYRLDDRLCVAANVMMDSAEDALLLDTGLQTALGNDGSSGLSSSVDGSLLTFTSCGDVDPI